MSKFAIAEPGTDPITTPIDNTPDGIIAFLVKHWVWLAGGLFVALLIFGLTRPKPASAEGTEARRTNTPNLTRTATELYITGTPTITQTVTQTITGQATQTPWIIKEVKDATSVYVDRAVTRIVPVVITVQSINNVEVTRLVTQLITATPAATSTQLPTQTPWIVTQIVIVPIEVTQTFTPIPPTPAPTYTGTVPPTATQTSTPAPTATATETATAVILAYPAP